MLLHGTDRGHLEKETAQQMVWKFGSDDEDGSECYTVKVRRKTDHENLVNPAGDKTASGWFKRAWCFQERMFASRILLFGGTLEDIRSNATQGLTVNAGAPVKWIASDDMLKMKLA